MRAGKKQETGRDLDLGDVEFVSQEVADRLRALEVHTLLQLAERLKRDLRIREYLGLDREAYDRLRSRIRRLVAKDFAGRVADLAPSVSKSGVAIDRLDADRPRYHGDSDD